MPKKVTKAKGTTKGRKTTKNTEKYDARRVLCRPSTWIVAVLALALLVIYGVSMYGFTHITPQTSLDAARLAVFDHLISDYIDAEEINADKPTVNEATGYGISDEDGVFYVTFDYATYTPGENQMPQFDDLKHGIMYFWKDAKRGTYSHAFSYHDDYYHPSGTYVEIGDHQLRTQLAPDGAWRNL